MISPIAQKLNSHGRPMVSLKELAEAMGLSQQGLYLRLKSLPAEDQPPVMRCAGALMGVTDSMAAWAEDHLAKNPRREW